MPRTLTATLDNGQTIEYLPEIIGEGGMKVVHFTPDRKSVVCFFKDAETGADPNRRARLQKIVGAYNPTNDPVTGSYWKRLYCWPTGVVVKPAIGVVAPTYAANFFFGSGPFKGKEKQASWFTSPKLRRLIPDNERGDWLKYLHISVRLARAVRRMHNAGLAHSDLSNRNVLVDPQTGEAVIIDIDSLVVPQLYPPDVLGTPGYIAPEVLATQDLELNDPKRNLPSRLTDQYALAVLIYEYLLNRHPLRGKKVNSTVSAEEDERLSMGAKAVWIENPKDNSNPPANPDALKTPVRVLGPYLAPLFERAFVDGLHAPNARPGANEWESALVKTSDLVLPCENPNCSHKWFIFNGDKRCPWCGTPVSRPVASLHFYREGRAGQFVADRHQLVVFHHQRLYKWHVFDNAYPGETADRTPQAYFSWYQNEWWLTNQMNESMFVLNGPTLQSNSATPLKNGMQIQLSRAPHGRLAFVQIV